MLKSQINTKLFDESGKVEMTVLSNSEGKRWIIPRRNASLGLQIYQPSSWKGKLIKMGLPFIDFFPLLKVVLPISYKELDLNYEISQKIKSILNIEKFQFSVFEGTPSANQKPIIQVFNKNEILCYVKISDNERIKKSFQKEYSDLEYLRSVGVKGIPKPMFYGEINHQMAMFCQSTVKTKKSRFNQEFNSHHWIFLESLTNKTGQILNFEDTDFSKRIEILENFLMLLPQEEKLLIGKAIGLTRDFFIGKKRRYSFSHGDFTPWNMFFLSGNLFVFDFEYSYRSFPPNIDFFHYQTQLGIIGRKLTSRKIYDKCKVEAQSMNKFVQDFDFIYLSYLLTIISLQFELHNKPLDRDDRCYGTWLELIEYLLENHEI